MVNYLQLLNSVLLHGSIKTDRTGVGTRSVFGAQMRFDLSEGFPLVTTKHVPLRLIFHELKWFLKGSTNIKYLKDNNVNIWDEWADENGELGPIYGYQWRSWPAGNGQVIDQIAQVMSQIRDTPDSRRIIVSAWNVADIPKMKLPPCHVLFQFYVVDGKLSCLSYQRSADLFLGVPFNIASYSLLTMLVAHSLGLGLGEFIWMGGDCHIYSNHVTQVETQLSREPKDLPILYINGDPKPIDEYNFEDLVLTGYDPYPKIPAPVAV